MAQLQEFESLLQGILPIEKSIDSWIWFLPGKGVQYSECGDSSVRGCLHGEDHHGGLDSLDRGGKAFVELYRKCCWRKECPVCYEKWASREASRAGYRLLNYVCSKKRVRKIFSVVDDDKRYRLIEGAFRSAKRKVIHVVFSPPSDVIHLNVRVLRTRLYKIAKDCGLFSGLAIFHPFRQRCVVCGGSKPFKKERCSSCRGTEFEWYFSPHFHVLGFGWIVKVKRGFERHGWVVKNEGVRKTVHGTLTYQLSHAGVHKNHHVVTWFGGLSYRKLFLDPMPDVVRVCPLCHRKLVDLVFIGGLDRPPPDKEGRYYLPMSDWRETRRYGRFG